MDRRIRIATRGSRLALWQANYIKSLLQGVNPGLEVELVEIVSTGDAVRDRPLFEIGGVGVFTKEVQEALLAGDAELAVHSLKDLPTQTHPSLLLAAVPPRETVDDVLLAPQYQTLDRLPEGAVVATSSLRRRAQLLRHRPDLQLIDIRGNVETRIRKLHEEGHAGLVLAAAGLTRLDLTDEITQTLPHDVVLPAVGQGALGLECRADDTQTQLLLAALEDPPTRIAVEAERAMLRELQGGCHVPIAAHATVVGQSVHLRGRVLALDGSQCIEGQIEGELSQAPFLGRELAQDLIRRGARQLLFPESGDGPSTG